jgi:hypothetical protein
MKAQQMPEPLKQYFLAQDNSAHWYLVAQDIREEWERWTALQTDDEASWTPPTGAERIDGPSTIVFCLPNDVRDI